MTALPEPLNTTVSEIYRHYEEKAEERRGYLGPSAIGNECDRALWYEFRWATEPEKFSGRMLRLFETGHREEERLVQNLRMIGVEVHDRDPETGRQWAVEYLAGHVKGHTDGVAIGFPEAPRTLHLLECKTHNEKSFKELVTKGVKAAKPAHWVQMQAYMHLGGWGRAFYIAQNKNTDELYAERVAYDPAEGSKIALRMERIVTAQEPPAKLSEKPDYYLCKMCAKADLCHGGEWPRRNCRTCLHATPDTVSGGWTCDLLKSRIHDDMVPQGCVSHLYIPAIVPGEQIDADSDELSVTYRLRTGGTWIDGGEAEAQGVDRSLFGSAA